MKIKNEFKCSVKSFLEDQKSKGNGLKEIAKLLNCHPSSLRKVGLEHDVSFTDNRQLNKEITYCVESPLFRVNYITNMNALSRNWCAFT